MVLGVGALAEQQPHHVGVAVLDGKLQDAGAIAVLGVGVEALGEELLDLSDVALGHSREELRDGLKRHDARSWRSITTVLGCVVVVVVEVAEEVEEVVGVLASLSVSLLAHPECSC